VAYNVGMKKKLPLIDGVEPACELCAFWEDNGSSIIAGKEYREGECLRYPRCISDPLLKYEGEWCGEFRKAEWERPTFVIGQHIRRKDNPDELFKVLGLRERTDGGFDVAISNDTTNLQFCDADIFEDVPNDNQKT
jgi:hypothetical protein